MLFDLEMLPRPATLTDSRSILVLDRLEYAVKGALAHAESLEEASKKCGLIKEVLNPKHLHVINKGNIYYIVNNDLNTALYWLNDAKKDYDKQLAAFHAESVDACKEDGYRILREYRELFHSVAPSRTYRVWKYGDDGTLEVV